MQDKSLGVVDVSICYCPDVLPDEADRYPASGSGGAYGANADLHRVWCGDSVVVSLTASLVCACLASCVVTAASSCEGRCQRIKRPATGAMYKRSALHELVDQ